MELAPDLFTYFEAGSRLLDRDTSLWCISSWNDHGLAHLVSDQQRLQRTDSFPGQAWMITNAIWQDIKYAFVQLSLAVGECADVAMT